MNEIKKRTKARVLLIKFFVPDLAELIPNFIVSLLLLLVASRHAVLVLLANGTPITDVSVGDVYGQRLDYVVDLLQVPILGRVVLFLFWLAVGSVVYVMVWLFQNFAVEVYDDVTHANVKMPDNDINEEEGWWGTTLSHTIFLGCSAILFLFYLILAINLLLPSWAQLFESGLQSLLTTEGFIEMSFALLGTMFTLHIFVLFWRVFLRFKSYIYNAF